MPAPPPSVPLISPPIDPVETEALATRLLNEFYKSYFDGAAHDVGTGPLTFPLCEMGFGQMTPELTKPLIHTIYASLRQTHDHHAPAGVAKRRFQVNALLNIFVRVANEGQAVIGAEAECRRIADYLKLTLNSLTERKRLTQKGLLHPRVESGPTAQPFPGVQVRLLVVSLEFVYRLD